MKTMKYILSIIVLGMYLSGCHATSVPISGNFPAFRISGDWIENKTARGNITDFFVKLNVSTAILTPIMEGSASEQVIVEYDTGYFINGKYPTGDSYNSTVTKNKLGMTPTNFFTEPAWFNSEVDEYGLLVHHFYDWYTKTEFMFTRREAFDNRTMKYSFFNSETSDLLTLTYNRRTE